MAIDTQELGSRRRSEANRSDCMTTPLRLVLRLVEACGYDPPMALSIPEQVAMLYTASGSQREVARRLGITHQRVGRLLKAAVGIGRLEGGLDPGSSALRAPDLVAGLAREYPKHVAMARAQARKDGIPFSAEVPIYYRRLPMPLKQRAVIVDPATGEIETDRYGKPIVRLVPVFDEQGKPVMVPGARVEAPHLHWVNQQLRDRWLTHKQRTDKFVSSSVGSLVNLRLYQKQADERYREQKARNPKHKRTKAQIRARKWIERTIKEGGDQRPMEKVFSRYTSMDAGLRTERVLMDINKQLRQRHMPAADEPGMVGATVLLQTPQSDPVLARSRTEQKKERRARKDEQAKRTRKQGEGNVAGRGGKRRG